MSENGIGRWTFLKGAGLTAVSAAGVGRSHEAGAQSVAPNSSGTEAPRVKAPANKPNDAMLFDVLAEGAPSEATRHRILVENPETLYGFTRSR